MERNENERALALQRESKDSIRQHRRLRRKYNESYCIDDQLRNLDLAANAERDLVELLRRVKDRDSGELRERTRTTLQRTRHAIEDELEREVSLDASNIKYDLTQLATKYGGRNTEEEANRMRARDFREKAEREGRSLFGEPVKRGGDSGTPQA